LTIELFKQRITLESRSIASNGEVFLYYNDGDLFWGHCIVVTMDRENQLIAAEIKG